MNLTLLNDLERLIEGLELYGPVGLLIVIHCGQCMDRIALDNVQRTLFK